MSKQTVKVLPSPTWRWLKVNDISIDVIDTIGSIKEINLEKDETKEPIKIVFEHNESTRECVAIEAKKDSKGIICIEHNSNDKGVCAGLTLNCNLEENAEVTIVEVVNLADSDSLIGGIVGTQAASSKLNIIQVFLGGAKVYTNIIVDLVGKGAFFGLKSAYRLYEKNELDINYVVNHIGENTECDLDTKGVLYKGANKTYRGTIDFKNGCKGSVGNEIEDVLLMEDDIVNKTVPVILCAEEDVEGNHGASIGRVSEELMFYMENRGISKEEVYTMMAAARVESVVRHIPDEDTKESLLEYLSK